MKKEILQQHSGVTQKRRPRQSSSAFVLKDGKKMPINFIKATLKLKRRWKKKVATPNQNILSKKACVCDDETAKMLQKCKFIRNEWELEV